METQQRHLFSFNVEITFCSVLGYPNSLILFHSKTALFWRRNLAGNKKTYFGLRVKFPKFLSDFNQVWIFIKLSNIKFHKNPSSGSRADTRTDKRTKGDDLDNRRFSRLPRTHRKTVTASCKITRQITRTQ
jgi:hypothetical protein